VVQYPKWHHYSTDALISAHKFVMLKTNYIRDKGNVLTGAKCALALRRNRQCPETDYRKLKIATGNKKTELRRFVVADLYRR